MWKQGVNCSKLNGEGWKDTAFASFHCNAINVQLKTISQILCFVSLPLLKGGSEMRPIGRRHQENGAGKQCCAAVPRCCGAAISLPKLLAQWRWSVRERSCRKGVESDKAAVWTAAPAKKWCKSCCACKRPFPLSVFSFLFCRGWVNWQALMQCSSRLKMAHQTCAFPANYTLDLLVGSRYSHSCESV